MRTLYSESDIRARVEALATEIAGSMPAEFLMAPVLTGAFVFAADLLRALQRLGRDPFVDFVQLSSYGGARASSGVVALLKDFSVPLKGKSILLIDDVLDTGTSLHFAKNMVLGRGAKEAKTCVLVRKATGHNADLQPDFIGFEAAADYIVGYGMDDGGRLRGLPFIAAAG